MSLPGILLPGGAGPVPVERLAAPDCFADLNLDQVVAAIVAGKEEYDLKPFFYSPLHDVDAIVWRHEILHDLENTRLFDGIEAFAQDMRRMREHLAQAEKLRYKLQKQHWFLDAVSIYCDAVARLAEDLSAAEIASRGLSAFRDYATHYGASERFGMLCAQTKKLAADLAAIRYSIVINGISVEVRHYGNEPDYSTEVEATFEKFKQGSVKDYVFKFSTSPEMNHVEAQVLDLVAQLRPEIFSALADYWTTNKDFADGTIVTFDREIQFYVAYLEHVARFKPAGLNFCYPRVVSASKEVYDERSFDLALAGKLVAEGATVVCNDFYLEGQERIIVVSGPNQGGKTTFARTFGQVHYLASLGCPVPGAKAQLFLFDKLFTHFEREENSTNLRGKLQDDLIRIHRILEQATPNSIVILNEIFTSTTLQDAVALSEKIAAKIIALDLLCLWVSFVDELASLTTQTVSMVSTVDPENPASRTFKVVRRPADGLAYAMSIAEKYRLTREMIRERVGA